MDICIYGEASCDCPACEAHWEKEMKAHSWMASLARENAVSKRAGFMPTAAGLVYREGQ